MATSFTTEKLANAIRFPFDDRKWVEKLFISFSMVVGSFLIVPLLFYMGYAYEIQRRMIVDGEEPSMPEWTDWGNLAKNGLKMYGVSLVYSLPYMLLTFPLAGLVVLLLVFQPDFLQDSLLLSFGLPLLAVAFLPVSLIGVAGSLMGLAAQSHMVARGEFGSAFRLGDVWRVFKANAGGYTLTFIVLYGIFYGFSILSQMLGITIILIPLMPLLWAVFTMLYGLTSQLLFARAYSDGNKRVAAGADSAGDS